MDKVDLVPILVGVGGIIAVYFMGQAWADDNGKIVINMVLFAGFGPLLFIGICSAMADNVDKFLKVGSYSEENKNDNS